MPEQLKKGWTRVAFGDVVRLCRDRSSDPVRDGIERYVGLEHLEPGDLKLRRWGNVADGTTFTSVFRAGQVLFGKRRAYQRKVAVADFDGVCSGDIYVFETKNEHLLPELLPFICQTDGFFEHAVGTSAGSLSPRTNWDSLASYEFPLPPLDEQRRIAEVLGALEALRVASAALRRRGQQIFNSIASEQFDSDTKTQQKLSDHYTISSGQVDPREPEYAHLPLIAPNHIEGRSGRLLKIETAEAQSAISGKYLFDSGSVLYSKIRPNLVKVTIAPCRGLCSADMYALIPKPTLHKEYLLSILLSDRFTQFAVSGSVRTGIPKLNREHLEQYKCHVPDMKEQEVFVSVIRTVQNAMERNFQYEKSLNNMRKCILEEFAHAI